MIKTTPLKTVFHRIPLTAQDARQAGIQVQYAAETAARIAAPGAAAPGLWEFENVFTLEDDAEITIFITADQRFEFYTDGALEAEGPDRSDVEHWSVAAWKGRLSAGRHEFRILHWAFSPGCVPAAQTTSFPFLLFACAEKRFQNLLNTGIGPWRVRRVEGVSFDMTAPAFLMRRTSVSVRDQIRPLPWQTPATVFPPPDGSRYGIILQAGHRLYPTPLPEQRCAFHCQFPGRVRAVAQGSGFDRPFTAEEIRNPEISRWQALLDSGTPVEIPPQTEFAVLIDLENYYCGFPVPEVSGGGEEKISISWHEALFIPGTDAKTDRARVEGLAFPRRSDGDDFSHFPSGRCSSRSFWWRAGRYVLVSIRTAEKSMTVFSLGFRETRYPLEDEGRVETSLPKLNAVLPALRRTMQMCAHESFMDCPYYEQLMYVGDTRLECLTYYVMRGEAALPMRAAELFDWSRHHWEGLVAEHYPSSTPQLSATFSMIWSWMVRDLMLYRRPDDSFIRRMRTGVRNLALCLLEYRNADGLLENLPGWSFVDWVSEWIERLGVPAGDSRGAGSIFQLQMIGTLQAAAELETMPGGDPLLREKFLRDAKDLSAAVKRVFWDEARGMISDDPEHSAFSEHAQCLAILFDVPDPADADRCYHALLSAPDLARTTIYYSFYLFETLRKRGDAHLIPEKMNPWYEAEANHAVTTWESPVPRSDCHAWGSHPLYHIHCSLAGIRPASFGFRTVEIRPQIGKIERLRGAFPHPDGEIRYDYTQRGSEFRAELELPDGLYGNFVFGDVRKNVHPGKNIFHLSYTPSTSEI